MVEKRRIHQNRGSAFFYRKVFRQKDINEQRMNHGKQKNRKLIQKVMRENMNLGFIILRADHPAVYAAKTCVK